MSLGGDVQSFAQEKVGLGLSLTQSVFWANFRNVNIFLASSDAGCTFETNRNLCQLP